MFPRWSLRSRIFVVIACMAVLAVGGTSLLTLHTARSNNLFTELAYKDILEYKTIQDMELALASQRGLLSSYVIDRDPSWREELSRQQALFLSKLNWVAEHCDDAACTGVLRGIEQAYRDSIPLKQKILDLLDRGGDMENVPDLLKEHRDRLLAILGTCGSYKRRQWQGILAKRARDREEARRLGMVELGAVVSYLALTVVLIVILMRQVLRPVRMMARETGSDQDETSLNEVKSLSSSLHTFIEDFDHTHRELARSREHLEQAEKMAMVGKLAAGVAHSIRNPFTSIKMRLFSLSRNLNMTETQKEDFEVVSEEIGRIDTIVQNFLEFARPPKIRIQVCRSSEVVDAVLQILKHRLQAFGIEVNHHVSTELPAIRVDPERLKEALINMVINACEAMESGGTIDIIEEVRMEGDARTLAIEVRDTGPGVPPGLEGKILQPFFTTKEEGTGLGLSIVAQIVEEHHGRLEVSSVEGAGTSFTVLIPIHQE